MVQSQRFGVGEGAGRARLDGVGVQDGVWDLKTFQTILSTAICRVLVSLQALF